MVALSVPDKLSVATYLVQYYNYFKDKAPSSHLPGQKASPPTNKPIGEPPPAAKRTKVETIGPASVQAKFTPSSPKITAGLGKQTPLATDKKNVSSPSLEHKTTPTHTTKPHPSPAVTVKVEKEPSRETSPEPAEQDHKVKRGRRSKFKSPPPSDGLTVTPTAPSRNSAKRGSMGMENCDACGQRVFLMERLAMEGHVFHRACFKCFTCKCLLKPGSYEFDSKGALFYCQAHYREALRQSTLKRTMQQRGLINGDEAMKEPTDAKRKKEEPKQPTSPAKSNQSPTSPTREITREESQKIKTGLPGLLKSLAGNKHEAKDSEGTMTSPKHETDKVKVETKTTEPAKTGNRIVIQSTAAPAKPQPPKIASQFPKAEPPGKVGSESSRRPTWSPKVQPREIHVPKTFESSKVATTDPPRRPTWSPKVQPREIHVPKTFESSKVATTDPPRRPTWSPKVQPRELPKTTSESPKVTTTEPPRRPTWSPKVQPRELTKGQPESPKVGGEGPRQPTWSPKIQPAEGIKSKGELPKTTLAWLAKGKEVENIGSQSSPKAPRHATISGVPAKPSPPITTVPAKPHPPVTVGRQPGQKKEIPDSIPEEPTMTKVAPPTSSDGPVKPPRRKKQPHPPEGKTAEQVSSQQQPQAPVASVLSGKRESVIPKRPAPPRPNRPPSLKRRMINGKTYIVQPHTHIDPSGVNVYVDMGLPSSN